MNSVSDLAPAFGLRVACRRYGTVGQLCSCPVVVLKVFPTPTSVAVATNFEIASTEIVRRTPIPKSAAFLMTRMIILAIVCT